jgi:predicted aminopeptidase
MIKDVLKAHISKVREQLHSLINNYGTNNAKTIAKSQELDRLLVEYMKAS